MAHSISLQLARPPCLAPRYRPLSDQQLSGLERVLQGLFGAEVGSVRGGQWVSMDSRSVAHETILEAPRLFAGRLLVSAAPEKITQEDLQRALKAREERSRLRPQVQSTRALSLPSGGLAGDA